MRFVLALGLIVALAGCVSTGPVVEPFTTPDGRVAKIAYCGGIDLQMSNCHVAARESCGGNYEVVEQVETPRVYTMMGSVHSTQSRRIVFICAS